MKRILTLTALLLFARGGWTQGREPSPPPETAALQAALDRQGFGVGLIDDLQGARTRAALADFKQARGVTDDQDLRAKLGLAATPAFLTHAVTPDDLDQVGEAPADWLEASRVPRMACRSLPEALSEKFHVSEGYLRRLNPEIADWSTTNLAGKSVRVPNILPVKNPVPAAELTVDCRQFRLRVRDAEGRLIASFPCSPAMAGKAAPRGDLKVTVFAPNPNYTFDPANYPESPRAQAVGRKLILPPGPNNPVGDYWIGLNRPGFGIHGTPHPETIGSRESHGCFRLTNWDVRRLSKMIAAGIPVKVTGIEGD